MKTNRLLGKDGMPIVDFVAIIFFSAFYILPSVNGSLNTILVMMAGLAYFAYVFIKDRKVGVSFISIFIAIGAIALAYTLLTETKTVSQGTFYSLKQFLSKFSQYLFMYLPALFLVRVLKTANSTQKRFLIVLIVILYVRVIYDTLQVVAVNPDAMRQWETIEGFEEEDIGNYYFVYSVPIVMVGISVCMAKMKGISKLICLGMIAVMFYFLLQAQYTLAILIAVLGFALQIFLSFKSPITKIVFVVVAVIAAFFIPDALLFVANNVESSQMATRFRELYSFFSEGDASGYNLNGRLTLYGKSLEAFFNSPIIGNRNLDFDGHATCFTVLSDTGIIGGIPFYYLLFSMNKRVKALLGKYAINFLPAFFCLLCMGFSNPIHSSVSLAFAVWFIVPLIIDTLINKEGERAI